MPPPDKTAEKSDRQSLLANLRQTHEAKRPRPVVSTGRSKSQSGSFDFSRHPAYSEVRVAKAAGQTLGVQSPFFRVAEAVRTTEAKFDGKWVRNFSSYDYLSLNLTEQVQGQAKQAIENWGISATASRLVGGERTVHVELEKRLAHFVGTESALAMVSGHATNMALVSTLLGPGDLVLVDTLAHNSIYEGIRASGAAHSTFPHNDFAWADQYLSTARSRYKNVLIVIEGLYSMDGDAPDLAKFIEVKRRHDTWLMVDEAHSVGVLGATGRGICEEQQVDPSDVEIIMGTLSKAFCSCGGFIAGSAALVDLMRYRAPGFVYSVGLSMPNAATAMASVDAIENAPERVQELRRLCQFFKTTAEELALDTGPSQGYAVCPIIIGDSLKAVWISNKLLEAGFNVLPIITPAVPNKSARLRFFLNYGHDEDMIRAVLTETAVLRERSKTMSLQEMAGG
ncbi:aminotransferase class I/II-fold pyridoxal phosphate-dependent enzyme [Pseudoruegeria sp. HB172150]|uniref:aminotransferase class I/II-fold pyridoxal phosphate-dependent enzyme n=1 Tax=Pseudoruegeria sp. HB172150 TaxID=2721164 RepID=UPI001556D7D1|nr:aminotransferase class I/II-fold pyridoxal phosphate-dependent enzyme [Pseudoruegeria sp. HB172150]